MASTTSAFVFTLMNDKQTTVNGCANGVWHEHFRQGTLENGADLPASKIKDPRSRPPH